jgi:23S rRNA (cytosine1962-C5)-methyltransferase
MEVGPLVEKPDWDAYALLDSGSRRKLERFGEHTLIRGEPKAWWLADRGERAWRNAAAEIGDGSGNWRLHGQTPRSWLMRYGKVTMEARLTDMSKHVGVFPEQEPHWRWLRTRLAKMPNARVLNLFGYTGIASLVCAAEGAQVTHVDASKPALNWARQNQQLSGLDKAPIRWLLDDAFKFVGREVRRERRYDVILLDPPSFGRGPRGEVWKVEQQITQLFDSIRQLLSGKRCLVILTLYNLEASSLMLNGLMQDYFPGGRHEFGELALPCREQRRLLPLSLFARWESD